MHKGLMAMLIFMEVHYKADQRSKDGGIMVCKNVTQSTLGVPLPLKHWLSKGIFPT